MLVIRSGRHPHEVMFLVFVAIVGTSGLLAPGKTANVVLKDLHPVFLILFYGVFAVGSILALAGAHSKGMKGPVIEAYGLGILTFEMFGYGIAVFAFAGITAIIGALFPLCMGIGNVWRMLQVRGEFKAAKAAIALAAADRPAEEE
jgi:hypothetical protein